MALGFVFFVLRDSREWAPWCAGGLRVASAGAEWVRWVCFSRGGVESLDSEAGMGVGGFVLHGADCGGFWQGLAVGSVRRNRCERAGRVGGGGRGPFVHL